MGLFGKKKTEEEGPKKTGIFGDSVDYTVYEMSTLEKITGYLIGFGLVFLVIWVFFQSPLVAAVMGAILGFKAIGIYRNHLLDKRNKELITQFRDLLESLSISYSAGKNTNDAFSDAYNDLIQIYGEDEYIVKELKTILDGLSSNMNIEVMLKDFADRSGLEDVETFADVFEVSLRQGANIKNIIGTTRDVICDKIDAQMDIRTILSGNQNELNIMLVMPVIICFMLNMNGTLGGGVTVIGIATKIIAIGIFVAAYALGRKITKISL